MSERLPEALSCGCPAQGPPCPHTAIPGKKRGGATQLRAERDALRAALEGVLAHRCGAHGTIEDYLRIFSDPTLLVALVALGRHKP